MSLSAAKFVEKVLQKLPKNRKDCYRDDPELIETVANLFSSLDGTKDINHEQYGELIFDESEQDIEYVATHEPMTIDKEVFSFDYITRVIDYVNSGHSFKSTNHTFRRVKYPAYITRFKEYLSHLGTNREKYAAISEYVFEKFRIARQLGAKVHDSTLKGWALEKATEVYLSDFKASDTWILTFKKKNKIVTRRITKFTTKHHAVNQTEIENKGVEFLLDFTDNVVGKFDPNFILNSDQSGFNYETHGSRTLSFQGERDTECRIGSSHALTHSYTIQPISMSGKLSGKFMIVLQEPSGEFGPRVRESLPTIPGLFITCTKSGKVDKQTLLYWRDNCLFPSASSKACLILDSYSAQRDASIFRNETHDITLKTLPAGTTGFLQPLDVYFFRQWKDFYKRFTERLLIDNVLERVHTRETVVKMQALIWNQFRAPPFMNMIKYAWQRSGFPVQVESFLHPKDILYNVGGEKCQIDCTKRCAFIRCAHCQKTVCCYHLYTKPHFHNI